MHEVEQMPERLAAFLQRHRDDVESIEVTEYEPMAGGYSRSMAKARVRYTSDGVTLEETVVLRGDPPAGHSMIETDRDHEWAVLAALTALGVIPIPAARYYDDSGEHLGTKAIVMDHVTGGSLQSLIEEMTDYGDHPTRLARRRAAPAPQPDRRHVTSRTPGASPRGSALTPAGGGPGGLRP